MSDKWMEMKQPMLLMQSHHINTILWCHPVVHCKISMLREIQPERGEARLIVLPGITRWRTEEQGFFNERKNAKKRPQIAITPCWFCPLRALAAPPPREDLKLWKENWLENSVSFLISYLSGGNSFLRSQISNYCTNSNQITNMLKWILSNATHCHQSITFDREKGAMFIDILEKNYENDRWN